MSIFRIGLPLPFPVPPRAFTIFVSYHVELLVVLEEQVALVASKRGPYLRESLWVKISSCFQHYSLGALLCTSKLSLISAPTHSHERTFCSGTDFTKNGETIGPRIKRILFS